MTSYRRKRIQVGLLSTFLRDSCIVGKSQQFFKLRDDKLCFIVNGFDKYDRMRITIFAFFSLHYQNINKNISHNIVYY